jgi:hypothetical protein
VVNAGKFILHFGTSSRDIFSKHTITVAKPRRYR